MHSWACPCRGPTPGAGWTPPRCPCGSGNFFRTLFISFPTNFVKRILLWNAFLDFPLSGSYPWGRVDAPQVSGWVCKFFQNPIYIISNKFCKKNFALKYISGLGLIWVTPEVLHEDYLQAYVPGAGGVGAGPSQGPDSKNRGPYESIHTL